MKPICFAVLCAVPFLTAVQSMASEKMQVVGLIENVRVDPEGLVFSAKMDTGADHSSVNARGVHRFKRKGEKWVRFRIVNDEGRSVTLERKLVRSARIKRPLGKSHKRPVVMLRICLGTFSREVQVNLVDRSRFRNKFLVGRSFMRDALLVDPSRAFTVQPQCPQRPEG